MSMLELCVLCNYTSSSRLAAAPKSTSAPACLCLLLQSPVSLWPCCHVTTLPLFFNFSPSYQTIFNKNGSRGLHPGSTNVGLLSRHLILCNCSDGLHGLWVFQYKGIILLCDVFGLYIFDTYTVWYVCNCPHKILDLWTNTWMCDI